jgi:hypothetical protein
LNMKCSKIAMLLLMAALVPGAFGSLALAAEKASVAGKVYCDRDKNGVCDCEEAGLAGLQVKMFREYCGGTALRMVSTDKQGSFTFKGVEPGTYFIMVDLDYVCGGRVPTTTNCRQIKLAAGETLDLPAIGYSEYGQ